MRRGRPRVRIGNVEIDSLRFDEAIDALVAMVERRNGGSVFTPNVDHVVIAEHAAEFREAYRAADLVLADGMPLIWASRILGRPLPEKVSGSDLAVPLARRCAVRGWSVYLLGGAPGVAQSAADFMRRKFRTEIAGADSATLSERADDPETPGVLGRIRRSHADVVLVALGAPKQEMWIHRNLSALRPAVAIGVGASLDFLAGRAKRAPAWVSRAGMEWLWRLVREPRRLWKRYLVRDPEFLRILWRTWRESRLSSPREIGA